MSTQIRLILVLFAFTGFAAHLAAAQELRFARIPAGQEQAVEALRLEPFRRMDYGAFLWLELSGADFDRLAASGTDFVPVPAAGTVQVMGWRFDPLADGEPALAPELRADEAAAGPGLRLVQLAGPAKGEWLAGLEAAGLRVLQYYPHHAYLVWGTAAQTRALEGAPFLRWQGAFHPGYKVHPELAELAGAVDQVEVMIYDDGRLRHTLRAIAALGGELRQVYPAQPDRAFYNALFELPAGAVTGVARLAPVLWLGYQSPEPVLEDEMTAQIVAGNVTGGMPDFGYQAWLAGVGVDGSGVVWSVTDSGVDWDHPDLADHMAGGYTYPGCADTNPGEDGPFGGHGTHVAGILAGDATTGMTDGLGYLWGQGVAPGVGIFAQNPICLTQDSWPPGGGWPILSKQGVLGGALGANNSWASSFGASRGYQSTERVHDFMVRDGDFDTPGVAEPYILVFSAGNSGPNPGTLSPPSEAKNTISVAGTQNYRVAGDVEALYERSSRGPTADGRLGPLVAAPAQLVASTRNDLGGFGCATPIDGTSDLYSYCSGTSMAAPHASGAIALIAQWWRQNHGGADPSPAMAAALLVNGAADLGGAPPIPNGAEGWGRVNLPGVIDHGAAAIYRDQLDVLDESGQRYQLRVAAADPARPLKVTLAWTDAPGAPGADPALVNDLDLLVDHGGVLYRGNRFSGGWSVSGGLPDALNNVENVFLESPTGAATTVFVEAAGIAGDGVPWSGDAADQDFALVCFNCAPLPDFLLGATPAGQEICAPQNAQLALTVDPVAGFTGPVSLGVTGEPLGTTATFSGNPVLPGGGSTLTLSNTGAAVPGVYRLTVTGFTSGLVRQVDAELKISDAAPGVPAPLAPADGALGLPPSPTLRWAPAAQGSTYELEVATDAAFTDVVYSRAVSGTEHRLEANLAPATLHHWRVRSTNACGTGGFSTGSTFTVRRGAPILLVDDDDNAPNARTTYTGLLDDLQLLYDVWDTERSDIEPTLSDLTPYEMVIWSTGADYRATAGPGADTEDSLAAYLDAGGCLFMSSQEVLFSRGLTPFIDEYLGVDTFLHDQGHSTVSGTGSVFGGLGPYTLSQVDPFFNFSDRVTADPDAETAFIGDRGEAAVVKDTGTYRTVFLAFAIENILDFDDREEIFLPILDFCGVVPPVFTDGFESGDLSAWSAAVGELVR